VRGQRGWVVDKPGEPGESGQELLVEQFLTQFYGDQAELGGTGDEATNPVPRQVLVPVLPSNAEELEIWLSDLRGSRVQLRIPHRGDKRALGETVRRKRPGCAGSAQAQACPVTSMRDRLHCRAFRSPWGFWLRRYASSASTSATSRAPDVVASLVVFEDGLPRKSDYRHYAIRERRVTAAPTTSPPSPR